MKIRFVDEAQSEFLDAISNYEEARAGLGRRFKDGVERCVLWIADHPELYRLRPGLYRRINLRVFPYYIPYIVRGDTLWVLAVAQASRKPLYWISRRDEVT
ncbi:MAG: type II toxin-antitoxin system RelE/ParE family toxin [Chthoniobacteraceae bacterium]